MTHICQTTDCNCSEESKTKELITKRPFTQIHLHSFSSLLDGSGDFKDYIKIAKENNHPGFALTDHGNPTGLFTFWSDMKKNGLKPILGLEFYMAENLGLRKPNRDREWYERDTHQSLYIKNEQGYKNFCKLVYLSYTEGYYYKPRINYEMLFENKEGLLATSSCMASYINQCIKTNDFDKAEELFKKFIKHFGDDFYGEIQFNEITDKAKFNISQKEINEWIIKLCKKHDVPILIGGDVHYAYKGDDKLQDILINNKRNNSKEEGGKKESFIHARHLYFHVSQDYYEFNKKFGYNYPDEIITQALDNSLEFLNKIDFNFKTGGVNFPKFPNEDKTKTNRQLLEDFCYDGLSKRIQERRKLGHKFPNDLIDKYDKQIQYELQVIEEKKIVDYFLIVQDVINWAKNNNIWCGPGRGSAAGALVSYCIGITDIDPIEHKLLFERFQNPERVSLPDIDCDFAQGSRDSIRKYLEDKYGKESVLSVVTFGTYGTKSAIQDVSRSLDKDTSFESILMREVTKLRDLDDQTDLRKYFDEIATKPTTTLNVKEWIKDNEETIKWADRLIGQIRNLGTHAGGILITPGPVYDYIPVTKGTGEIVTAFKEADGSSKDLSELGLLKLDILGLKTLNVIQDTISMVKKDFGIDLTQNLKYPDLNDKKVLKTVCDCDVLGIFQFDLLALPLIKEIKPDSFEDLNAINALNRPGPKDTFGPLYGKWKRLYKANKQKECEKDEMYPKLDFMKKVTEDTYGCLLYQEQFMMMVKEAADFNMGEADSFRRCIAWQPTHPKYYQVEAYFKKLTEGMTKKGYSLEDVNYFVDYARKFMGYSFNRSHSCSYAFVAYQCAYLKTYYPTYFYCAYANYEKQEEYQKVISELIAKDINILPPSFNKSKFDFTVEKDSIRIGLKAIKGLGDAAINEMNELEVSKYDDLYELLKKKYRKVNSGVFKKLIDCGCFDEFNVPREKIEIIRALYSDKDIEKWFTRKKGRLQPSTMPKILEVFEEETVFDCLKGTEEESDPWSSFGDDNLSEFFSFDNDDEENKNEEVVVKEKKEAWELFIENLINHIPYKQITDKKKSELQEEILGFSLEYAKRLKKIDEILDQHPLFKTMSERKGDSDLCVWYLVEKTKKQTKKGNDYWLLKIADKSSTVNAKCWEFLDFHKDSYYVSKMKQDDYGMTIVADNQLKEI